MNDRFKFRFFNEYSNKLESCDEYDLKDIFESSNPVMQCTGLKDKNGKLIYEGDIIKIKNEVFFIKYEIGSFLIIRNEQSLDAWYEMFTEAWNDDVYPLSQLYVDEYIQEEYIDCMEVIGNIYENKELLEDK